MFWFAFAFGHRFSPLPLAAALARLDRQRAGELPRSKVEAATRRHCRAIPQHVIDRAVAAAAEAAE